MDDKREPIEANDLPGCLEAWKKRDVQKDTDRKKKAFFVPAEEIRQSNYDLSLNRYKEQVYEEQAYDPPAEILLQMKSLNNDIARDLDELEGLLQ